MRSRNCEQHSLAFLVDASHKIPKGSNFSCLIVLFVLQRGLAHMTEPGTGTWESEHVPGASLRAVL